MSNFVLTFPLETEPWQEAILDKRMELDRRIYNQCVKKSKVAYAEMIKTKKFRAIRQELKDIYELKDDDQKVKRKRTPREKELFNELNKMYKEYGFTEFGMIDLAFKQARKAYKKHFDSGTASKIGKRLWTAWNRFLFGNGKEVHFCRYNSFNSLEGATNKYGMKLRKTTSNHWNGEKWAVVWNKLEIPAKIDENNMYEQEAMRNEIAFNRIIRRVSNGKVRYYVQVVFRGIPPQKRDKKTGELKHMLGSGKVGLYIGLTAVTVVTDDCVKRFPLADGIQPIAEEQAEIQRKMDRSRRAMNPDNYNADGTIKKQGNKKVRWIRSNNYKRLQTKLHSLMSKQAQVRKYQHECLKNEILSMGDCFIINKQEFSAMQKRKTETEVKEDGTYKSKKQYGTVIANHAPAEFVQYLERKLGYYEQTLHVINVKELGIDRLNHATGEIEERDAGKKLVEIAGTLFDIRAYKAFLLQNMDADFMGVDVEACTKKFDSFVEQAKIIA